MVETHDDDSNLVPMSLSLARQGLGQHPLARTTTALTTFTNVPSYDAQMAHTGLGYDVDGGARRLWSVSKVPLYGPDGLAWPGAFGTRRDDTGARLGVVGARYKPLQNAQLAEALDLAFMHLPQEFRPRILSAGALGGGIGMGATPPRPHWRAERSRPLPRDWRATTRRRARVKSHRGLDGLQAVADPRSANVCSLLTATLFDACKPFVDRNSEMSVSASL